MSSCMGIRDAPIFYICFVRSFLLFLKLRSNRLCRSQLERGGGNVVFLCGCVFIIFVVCFGQRPRITNDVVWDKETKLELLK